jgi:hypothetical protein
MLYLQGQYLELKGLELSKTVWQCNNDNIYKKKFIIYIMYRNVVEKKVVKKMCDFMLYEISPTSCEVHVPHGWECIYPSCSC